MVLGVSRIVSDLAHRSSCNSSLLTIEIMFSTGLVVKLLVVEQSCFNVVVNVPPPSRGRLLRF